MHHNPIDVQFNDSFMNIYIYIISSTHFLSHLNMHNLTSKENMQMSGFQT